MDKLYNIKFDNLYNKSKTHILYQFYNQLKKITGRSEDIFEILARKQALEFTKSQTREKFILRVLKLTTHQKGTIIKIKIGK